MTLANPPESSPEDQEWENDPAVVKSLRYLCRERIVEDISGAAPVEKILVCNRARTDRRRLVLSLRDSATRSRNLEIRHFAHLVDTSGLPATALASLQTNRSLIAVRVESSNTRDLILLMRKDDFEEFNASATSLLSWQQWAQEGFQGRSRPPLG